MDSRTQQELNDAIVAVQRFANSRKLDEIHEARSGVNLSTVAVNILKKIAVHGPVSLSDLGGFALMRPAALSRQISTLKSHRYIDVDRSPHDGRVSIATITDAGRDALRTFDRVNGMLLSSQLKDWTDDEILRLAAQMQRLVTDLRAPVAEDGGGEGSGDDAAAAG